MTADAMDVRRKEERFSPVNDLGIVIVAAGASRRFGGGRSKLLSELGGIPLFLHSVGRFAPCAAPGALVVVLPADGGEEFRSAAARLLPEVAIRWTAGGATRAISVRNGIAALPDGLRYVAIHDAARPLASAELLRKLAVRARECGGAIPGVPVADSLKRLDADGMIAGPVERDNLYAVATPQVFALDAYRQAILAPGVEDCTDDAEVMRRAGYAVALVTDYSCNLKVTTPADLEKLRREFRASAAMPERKTGTSR